MSYRQYANELAKSMLGIDEQKVADDGTYTYVGMAKSGTATSAAAWRVLRFDADGSMTRADGDAHYDNIWDNYATLSYS